VAREDGKDRYRVSARFKEPHGPMHRLRLMLQAARCLPVSKVQLGRQIVLQHLPDSAFELQKIPANKIRAYHRRYMRFQIRVEQIQATNGSCLPIQD